jgi:anti-sigma-K factor RskA
MADIGTMHIEEHAAAYALDALEPAEVVLVEAHVRSCPSCAELVTRAQRVAGLLGLAVDAEPPAPGHYGRLWNKVRPEQRVLPLRGLRRRLSVRRSWLALAAAAVLVLAFGGWNLQLRQELSSQDQLVRLVAMGEPRELSTNTLSADVHGRAYVDRSTNQVALTVSRLPQLAGNRRYEIWFTRADGGLVRGDTFQTAADGSAAVLASAPGGLQAYVGVGVTDEPLGGSGAPSTPMLMYWVI